MLKRDVTEVLAGPVPGLVAVVVDRPWWRHRPQRTMQQMNQRTHVDNAAISFEPHTACERYTLCNFDVTSVYEAIQSKIGKVAGGER